MSPISFQLGKAHGRCQVLVRAGLDCLNQSYCASIECLPSNNPAVTNNLKFLIAHYSRESALGKRDVAVRAVADVLINPADAVLEVVPRSVVTAGPAEFVRMLVSGCGYRA